MRDLKHVLRRDGVADVHHVHLWNLASDAPALSAHVVVAGEPLLRDAQRTADRVKATLAERFALTNVTVELEARLPAAAPAQTAR